MAKGNERFKKRNQDVRITFHSLSKKNPKWRIEAIVEDVADKFYLASRTVEAILRQEGIYKD